MTKKETQEFRKNVNVNDWDSFPEWANYRAYNTQGIWTVYEHKPSLIPVGWIADTGKTLCLGRHPKKKGIRWRDSLSKRP